MFIKALNSMEHDTPIARSIPNLSLVSKWYFLNPNLCKTSDLFFFKNMAKIKEQFGIKSDLISVSSRNLQIKQDVL